LTTGALGGAAFTTNRTDAPALYLRWTSALDPTGGALLEFVDNDSHASHLLLDVGSSGRPKPKSAMLLAQEI
jgi:hypothetical protein